MRATVLLLSFFLLTAAQAQFFGRNGPRLATQNRGRAARMPVPQGYLPPTPTKPVCMPIPTTVTDTSTRSDVVTSYVQGPGGGVSTSVALETRVQPTTVYKTDVSTRYSTYTQLLSSTRYQPVTSTYVTSIGGVPVTRTVVSTVTIPERVVSTDVTTIRSSTYITRTETKRDVTTIVQPYTSTTTEQRIVTSTDYVKGSDVTRTNTITSTRLSTVVTQPPPTTIYQTSTIQSIIQTTTVIQPPPTQITRTQTTTQLDDRTRTTTVRDVTTRTEIDSSVIASSFTVRDTRTQTVTTTYQLQETSQVVLTSTRITTQYVPTTVYDINVITRTQSQPPVYRTSSAQTLVTETLPGGANVVTSSRYTTEFVQTTTTVSVGGGQQTVTVTTTVQEKCGQTGYTYNKPSVAFRF